MAVEISVPQLGESVSEAVIARWLKQNGDEVRVDEPLLELETDRATMEVAASASGRLEIVEPEGAHVRVGAVVGRIAEQAAAAPSGSRPAPAAGERTTAPAPDRAEPARP